MKIMFGEEIIKDDLFVQDSSSDGIIYFKYTSLSSAEIKRNFLQYNNMLVDNRRSLTFD